MISLRGTTALDRKDSLYRHAFEERQPARAKYEAYYTPCTSLQDDILTSRSQILLAGGPGHSFGAAVAGLLGDIPRSRNHLWDRSGGRGPLQHELALTTVQAARQPYSPYYEVVSAEPGEDVPPTVALQENRPRQQDGVSSASKMSAKDIVQNPNGEANKEEGNACNFRINQRPQVAG